MKPKRFSEEQIIAVLREHDAGAREIWRLQAVGSHAV